MQQSGQCCYRIVYEGLLLLLPHMRKQVARIPIEDFLLLTEKRVLWLKPPTQHAVDAKVEEGPVATEEGPSGEEGPAGEEQDNPSKKPKLDTAVMPVHLEAVQTAMQDIAVGCCVVLISDEDCRQYGLEVIQQDGQSNLMGASLYACLAWKGKVSVTIQVPKVDCQQLAEELRSVLGLPVPPRTSTKNYRLPPGTSSLNMLHQLGAKAAENEAEAEVVEGGDDNEVPSKEAACAANAE